MRIALALAAAGMLLTVGSAVAQEPTPPMMRFPPLSGTPFLDLIRDASARMRLTDLRAAPRGARRELRLWDGFGLSGVQLLILRETASGWRAFYAPQVHGERRLRIANLPDTGAWVGRWQ